RLLGQLEERTWKEDQPWPCSGGSSARVGVLLATAGRFFGGRGRACSWGALAPRRFRYGDGSPVQPARRGGRQRSGRQRGGRRSEGGGSARLLGRRGVYGGFRARRW